MYIVSSLDGLDAGGLVGFARISMIPRVKRVKVGRGVVILDGARRYGNFAVGFFSRVVHQEQ